MGHPPSQPPRCQQISQIRFALDTVFCLIKKFKKTNIHPSDIFVN